MPATSERILGAQRALLQTSQDIGLKTLDGVARLVELNMQAMRTVLAAGGDRMGSLGRPGAAAAAATASFASMQSESAASASYLRQISELAASTGSELVTLMQRQAIAWQSLANELTAAVWQTTPVNNDMFAAMMRNPFEAAQGVFQQATGAVAQAADTAAQTGRAF